MAIDDLEFTQQIASTSSNLTLNHFQKIHAEGSLVLRPPFQRNLVWNQDQQGFLVDSILRGLPVPEIYIQTQTSADGDEKTLVVDGQQRITACLRFLAGRLRLADNASLDSRWRNCIFSELDEKLKQRFRSFKLIARELPDLGEDALREVFRRLNETVEPLESQELRHAAYTGPFVKLIEQVASKKVFTELGLFSPKDYLRRRNDEFIAEVSHAVIVGAFPNKKDGLDTLFLTYERQGVPSNFEELEHRFGRALAELGTISSRLRKTRFRNKSDFYSLFILLAKRGETLPLPFEINETFMKIIGEFSALVNEIKREESAARSINDLISGPNGEAAVKYLRSVERAASDRLSRVRREEALVEVLGQIFNEAPSVPLSESDSAWRLAVDPEDEEEDEFAEEYERMRTRQTLLEAPVDTIE